jgi:hypothetical protein
MTLTASPGLVPVYAQTAAHAAAPTYPPFQGPFAGTTGGQSPLAADFSTTCNVQASSGPVTAAQTTIAAGTAVTDPDTCGQGYLFLSVPGAGHFTASAALADNATIGSAGTPALRIFVLGSNGYTSRSLDVLPAKGTASTVNLDLAGAVALAVTFPSGAQAYLFNMRLTGTAQLRRATPMSVADATTGGAPVSASRISFACNDHLSTTLRSVSHVTIPTAQAIDQATCGGVTITLPPGLGNTLTLRYGASDASDYTSVPTVFDVRVLDKAGHLLRKAVGLAFLGGGLQPIWVDVTGGATVTFAIDAGNADLEVTDLRLLPAQYKMHPNPNHNEFGSPSGSPVSIVPDAFAIDCNAHPGADDITVNRLPVLRDTYLNGTRCGVASLIMTNAHGSFHALVGMNDSTSPETRGALKLTVLDQNGKPLFITSVQAAIGKPAVPLSAPITGGSIVKLEFAGPGLLVLYNLQLAGQATFYDRVFPPSEPPVSTPNGTVVNPLAFKVDCNAAVSTTDILLIHEAALEQWALDGQRCGTAILDLRTLHQAKATFGGRIGLAAADQHLKLGHVQVQVLAGNGKILRTVTLIAREGYGPRPFLISLAGAASIKLSWPDQRVIVFAMSTT